MDRALLPMFGETALWRPLVDIDSRLNKTYGPAVSILCLGQRILHMVTNAEGVEVMAGGKLYCAGAFTVNPADEITDPSGKKPQVISVEMFSDNHGPYASIIHTS